MIQLTTELDKLLVKLSETDDLSIELPRIALKIKKVLLKIKEHEHTNNQN